MAEEAVKMPEPDDDLRERRDVIAERIIVFEKEIADHKEFIEIRRSQVRELREKLARYNMALGLTRKGEPRKQREAKPEDPSSPVE
jgi:uncharacterized coiled-coil DUF342 family protein